MGKSLLLHSRVLHFSLLSIVGFLFFYKYGLRVHSLLPILYLPYITILYFYVFKFPEGIANQRISKWFVIIATTALVGLSCVAFQYVHVQDLKIDRWSVITHYWDAYFSGENPYSSTSHMGNYYGSYPFYFIVNLPFYLIGEIGWMPIFSFILFLVFIHWHFKDWRKSLMGLILSIGCLCLPYEIITRSTIFANSVFILLTLYALIETWHTKKTWLLCLIAFIVGLMVCSRPVYGLVFLIAAIYLMKVRFDIRQFLAVGIFSVLGLVLPFLHLYLLFPLSIMEYNPITFMTSHFVPTWFYIIYLIMAVTIGWMIKEKHQIIPASGIFLFLVVVCYAIRYILTKGWHEAVFAHFIDLSYFFMAVPFLVWAIVLNYSLRRTN